MELTIYSVYSKLEHLLTEIPSFSCVMEAWALLGVANADDASLDLPYGLKLGKVKLTIHRGWTGPQSYAPDTFTAPRNTFGTHIGWGRAVA